MQSTDLVKPVPCAFCGVSVVSSDFVLCSACRTPAHRACWNSAARCSVYACGSTETLEPALALFRSDAPVSECWNETSAPSDRARILGEMIQALETSVRPHRARLLRLSAFSAAAGTAFAISLAVCWPAAAVVCRSAFTLWLLISIAGFFTTVKDRAVIRAIDAKLGGLRSEFLVAQALTETKAAGTDCAGGVGQSVAGASMPASGVDTRV